MVRLVESTAFRNIGFLTAFSVHLLPGFERLGEAKQHCATWLPQLAQSFASAADFEFHWITLTTEVSSPRSVSHLGQTFHLLPTATRKRASTLFYQDRKAIRKVLDTLNPELVPGWGTEDVYALAAVLSGFPNIVSMAGLLSYYVLKTKMHPRDYFQSMLGAFCAQSGPKHHRGDRMGEKRFATPYIPPDLSRRVRCAPSVSGNPLEA